MPSFVRNVISGLSERERRLVFGMAIVAVLMIFVVSVVMVRSAISDLETANGEDREALELIAAKRADYMALKAEIRGTRGRATSKPTPLRTLVDKIGKELDVVVPDVKEFPDQKHGVKWVEHSAELSLRQVELPLLVKFMEKTKEHNSKFPIAISKLEVRKRRRESSVYDVKMTISTYEQVAPKAAAAAAKPSKGGQ